MDRPRFSTALIQRRRELGLSTAQASRVLKLKEQVLIALEDGDFEAIPKSGYAQGMVSSYSRYLGLDAREMVDLFQEDLANYEAEQGIQKRGRGAGRSSQHMRLTTQRPAVDDSRRNLLPTSGGRAGDMGDFATTSTATTRSASVPLVSAARMRESYDATYDYNSRYSDRYAGGYGGRSEGGYNDRYADGYGAHYEDSYTSGYGERYAGDYNDRYEGGYNDRYADSYGTHYAGGYASGYGDSYEGGYIDDVDPYARQAYDDDYRPARTASRKLRSGAARGKRSKDASQRGTRASLTGDNITRTRYSDTYQDDRVEDAAINYEPAYSEEGRRAAHRIQRAGRPQNSSRRRSSGHSRGRSRRQSQDALTGLITLVSESRVVIGVVALLIVVILVVAVVLGVKSCSGSQSETDNQSVPVSTTVTSTNSGTIGEPDEQNGTENPGSAPEAQNETGDPALTGEPTTETSDQNGQAVEPINAEAEGESQSTGETISTEVSVSVASGESTWLEIMADGESRIADQVLGPWTETYVVSESLTVSADNTSAVSVFENGEVRSFDNKASGVGNITIKVPVRTVAPTEDVSNSE